MRYNNDPMMPDENKPEVAPGTEEVVVDATPAEQPVAEAAPEETAAPEEEAKTETESQ